MASRATPCGLECWRARIWCPDDLKDANKRVTLQNVDVSRSATHRDLPPELGKRRNEDLATAYRAWLQAADAPSSTWPP